jgi:ribosomal protein S18 acetylase RimI-like enzyme
MNPHPVQSPVHISLAKTDRELFAILDLQQQNLPHNISKEEAMEQGFVTVEHSFDVLSRMNEKHSHVIAKSGDAVIGYALVMTKEMRNEIPVLIPLFEMIDKLKFDSQPLSAVNYFVMGQICISKSFRGLSIFDALYAQLKSSLQKDFDYCITEVAVRNRRSIRAHRRVGFVTAHVYTDARGEEWEIMVWKWPSFQLQQL